jgi:hypothetical protein
MSILKSDRKTREYRSPKSYELNLPAFQRVWNVIKKVGYL